MKKAICRGGGPASRVFRRVGASLLVATCLAAGRAPEARAQGAALGEYRVKAAFLYNFAKFVEWPEGAFADAGAPLVIGILGEDPFEDALDGVIRGKTASGRALAVKRSKDLQGVGACHILFISSSERKRIEQIVEGLQGASVLTVGETEAFTRLGGVVGFVVEEGRVRFEINADSAERARLRVSSKLLALARVVRNGRTEKD
jgi:hypothetical protein